MPGKHYRKRRQQKEKTSNQLNGYYGTNVWDDQSILPCLIKSFTNDEVMIPNIKYVIG